MTTEPISQSEYSELDQRLMKIERRRCRYDDDRDISVDARTLRRLMDELKDLRMYRERNPPRCDFY